MPIEWAIKGGDIAIVFATLLGPVLAVQAQKWVERGRERAQRRVQIFRTLMATRAAPLSPAHVEALNAIPIEFYGTRGGPKEINEAWKAYLDRLSQPNPGTEVWNQGRLDSFNELLVKIAGFLRYKFTPLEIRREVYFPTAHAQIQTDQDVIRQGLARLFRGEISLPMDVKTLPVDPQFAQNQVKLQEHLLSWLTGERSVKVVMAKPDDENEP